METDEQLMLAYQAGNAQAFETLVRRYWDRVYGFVCRMVKDDVLAEDILSETFFKLHRSAPTYETRARFSTFLFTIAYREGISALRSSNRHQTQVSLSLPAEKMSAEGRALSSPLEGPDELVERQESFAILERVLQEIPPAQRAAFALFYGEGLSVQDISRILEVQPSSVRAYLTQARTTLRQRISALEARKGTGSRSGRDKR